MKMVPITGQGIFWGAIFGFIGLFIPGIIPLGILGPFGPLIGIILGAYCGLLYGYGKSEHRREKAIIHQANLKEARKNR